MSAPGDNPPEFRALLWLTIAMVLCTLPFFTYLPLWLLPALAALGWWRLDRARHGKSAPPGAQRGLAAVGLAGSLIATGNVGFGLESAIPLYTAFLWLKLVEVKNERDLFMAAYLSCFLAGSGVLLEQGLGRTVFAILALLMVVATVLGHHLRAGRIDIGLRMALRRAGVLLLQAAPAAAVLFLVIPRPQIPFPVERGQGVSGVSDRLRPGDFDKIALSQELAFRVTFPYGERPDPANLYWRGLALTNTDGIGWYREPMRSPRPPQSAAAPAGGGVVVQEITLLPHLRTWLYALDTPLSWPDGVRMASGSVLMRERQVSSPLTYRIASDIQRGAEDSDGGMLNACQSVPERLDPRLGELAQEWRTRAGGDGASAAAISDAAMAWFREQGFSYSLEPGAMEGDPSVAFLFERRSGFCSHYSSAFALLMRMAKIPARVVVGYRGGEWNDLGDFLAVRQAHAHAWCEVWDEPTRRWLRVDPTGAVVGEAQAAQMASDGARAVPGGGGGGLWDMFRVPRKWWEFFDTAWESWMFRYDGTFQSAVAQSLGLGAWGFAALVAVGVLGSAACLSLVWWALRRRGRQRDPVARLYARWCARLARAGCIKRADETPLAFAERACIALPARATEIHAVTQAYCAARYAAEDPQALPRLRAALA